MKGRHRGGVNQTEVHCLHQWLLPVRLQRLPAIPCGKYLLNAAGDEAGEDDPAVGAGSCPAGRYSEVGDGTCTDCAEGKGLESKY